MIDKSITKLTSINSPLPNNSKDSKKCFERSCSVPKSEINYAYLSKLKRICCIANIKKS